MIFSIVGSQLFTSTNDLDLKKSWIKRIFG